MHAVVESRGFAAVSAGQESQPDEISFDLVWLLGCLAFVAFEVIAAACAFAIPEISAARLAAIALGAMICCGGMRLRCLAIADLGARFAEPPFHGAPPTLASGRLYALVRHPSELGLLMFCAGLAAVVAVPVVLVAFLLLILPMAALRIAREEHWLQSCLGPRHRQYRRDSPRLVWPRARDLPALLRLAARSPTADGGEPRD